MTATQSKTRVNPEQGFTECKELEDLRGVKSLKVIHCHSNGSLYRECLAAWQLIRGTFLVQSLKGQLKAPKIVSTRNLRKSKSISYMGIFHLLKYKKSFRNEQLFEMTTPESEWWPTISKPECLRFCQIGSLTLFHIHMAFYFPCYTDSEWTQFSNTVFNL